MVPNPTEAVPPCKRQGILNLASKLTTRSPALAPNHDHRYLGRPLSKDPCTNQTAIPLEPLGPEDHINFRYDILVLRPETRGIPETTVCRPLVFMCSVGCLILSGPCSFIGCPGIGRETAGEGFPCSRNRWDDAICPYKSAMKFQHHSEAYGRYMILQRY